MPRAIMLIGRLCSGKTTYAHRLEQEEGAIFISSDELMQTLFPEPMGEAFDLYCDRAQTYLYHLARVLARGGAVPVMEGFWNRRTRERAIRELPGITLDWRYLDVSDEEWHRRIAKRNAAITAGQGRPSDYFVDEGLLQKAIRLFEPPTADEGLNLTVIRDTEPLSADQALGRQMYARACEFISRRYPTGWGGCAVMRTADGRFLTSVYLDAPNSAAELCMETGAMCEAQRDGLRITHTLCAARSTEAEAPRILTACGICQERLMYWGKGVQVAVTNPDNAVIFRTLEELAPEHWGNAYPDERKTLFENQ